MKYGNRVHVESIWGMMSPDELDWLAEFAKDKESWTEVGVMCGRSLLCVGLHLPKGALLVGVDIKFGQYQRAGQTAFTTVSELQQRRPDLRLIMVQGPSIEMAQYLPDTDAVFLDGDHSLNAVSTDVEVWREKCKFISGHDHSKSWPGVQSAVEIAFGKEYEITAGSIWSARGDHG